MTLKVELTEHAYNNIMAVDAINLGRMPYKGIIVSAINAIKRGEVQEPCEECVSRQAVIDTIYTECSGTKLDIDFAKVLMLQRAIKAIPSVIPQEQEPILDKIRAEIQENINYNKKMNYQGIVAGLALSLAIIDKYKAESEDKG